MTIISTGFVVTLLVLVSAASAGSARPHGCRPRQPARVPPPGAYLAARVDPRVLRAPRSRSLTTSVAGARLWHSRGVRHVYECPMRWADMDLQGTSTTSSTSTTSKRRASTCSARTPPARRTGELAEALVVVRHEVHYRGAADLRVPARQHRVLGHRHPGGVVHDGLRGLPRGRPATRRPHASTCGPPPCSRRSSSRPSGRAGSAPTSARPSRRTSRTTDGADPPAAVATGAPRRGRPLPGARPLLRRRRLRARQQRQVLRVLHGGAASCSPPASGRRCPEGMPAGWSRADRRRLQGADPVPSRAVRRVVLADPRRRPVDGHRVRDLDGDRCSRGPGSRWSSSTPARAPAGAAARGPRTVARRSRSLDPALSKVLTMNCAAWVT